MIECHGQLFSTIHELMDYTQAKAAARSAAEKAKERHPENGFDFMLSSGHRIVNDDTDAIWNPMTVITLSNDTEIILTHVCDGIPLEEQYFIFQHQYSDTDAQPEDPANGILYESPQFKDVPTLQAHLDGYLQGLLTSSGTLIKGRPCASDIPFAQAPGALGFIVTKNGHDWSKEGLEAAAEIVSSLHRKDYTGKDADSILWNMGAMVNDPSYLAWLLQLRPHPQIVMELTDRSLLLTADDGTTARETAYALEKAPKGISSWQVLFDMLGCAFKGKTSEYDTDNAASCLISAAAHAAIANNSSTTGREFLEFGDRRRFAHEASMHRTGYTVIPTETGEK